MKTELQTLGNVWYQTGDGLYIRPTDGLPIPLSEVLASYHGKGFIFTETQLPKPSTPQGIIAAVIEAKSGSFRLEMSYDPATNNVTVKVPKFNRAAFLSHGRIVDPSGRYTIESVNVVELGAQLRAIFLPGDRDHKQSPETWTKSTQISSKDWEQFVVSWLHHPQLLVDYETTGLQPDLVPALCVIKGESL